VSGERLAIDGGSPVRASLLPYARLTTGPRVPAFEEALVAATGARHAVAFSSGTAALHGAMASLALAPGAEVLTTPMTFAATANAILYVGAEPRFADVDSATLLLDPAAAVAALAPGTRALVAVDYAGQPADYVALRAVADAAPGGPIPIVADAAHSLGATRAGRRVGTLADLTVLSLHPAKILTTGEGGAVLTDDGDRAAFLRRFRNHGIGTELAARRDWVYAMVELGYNYRLTDVMAALGTSQLARLDTFLASRRRLAARYRAALAGHWALDVQAVASDADPAWHLFVVLLRLDRLRVDRAAVYHALRAEGIGVNVHYIPVHRHPFYRERYPDLEGRFPVAEAAYERLLTLPLFSAMTDRDLDDVVAALDKVTAAYRAG
jgi:perosamine synthetase